MAASPTTTIRVSRRTRDILQALAEESGRSVPAVLAEAVERYWGQRLLEATNEAYAVLRANTAAWQELQGERAEWDVTLNDGLKCSQFYYSSHAARQTVLPTQRTANSHSNSHLP